MTEEPERDAACQRPSGLFGEVTNSMKFLLAAELEFRHSEVAPFHSKTLDFQYWVWVLYACEEKEDEKKQTFGLGRICRKGEKCHRIVRNGGDDGGGRRVVPCQGVEGGIEQLGRAGAEDYIFPLGSRVAHKPMKKPHMPFQLSRHVRPEGMIQTVGSGSCVQY